MPPPSLLPAFITMCNVGAGVDPCWLRLIRPELTATTGGPENTRASTEPARGQIGHKAMTENRYTRRSEWCANGNPTHKPGD